MPIERKPRATFPNTSPTFPNLPSLCSSLLHRGQEVNTCMCMYVCYHLLPYLSLTYATKSPSPNYLLAFPNVFTLSNTIKTSPDISDARTKANKSTKYPITLSQTVLEVALLKLILLSNLHLYSSRPLLCPTFPLTSTNFQRHRLLFY